MLKFLKYTFLLLLAFTLKTKAQELQGGPSQKVFESLEKPVFKKNNGQWESDVQYKLLSGQTSVLFFKNKIQFGLRKALDRPPTSKEHPDNLAFSIWELEFSHSSVHSTIKATGESKSKVNYFYGSTGVGIETSDFTEITYKNIYPMIDLVFYFDQKQNLKYDFRIHPGGDYHNIELRYNGIEKLKVDPKGNLNIKTAWNTTLKEGKPISWQLVNGKKIPVEFRYKVNGKKLTFDSKSITNPNAEIVIDPLMLDWSTYFYGKLGSTNWGYTYVMDMDIDKDNNVYVTGFTNERFPMKTGTYDTIPNSTSFWDGFVAKMSTNGDSLIYFTYIGGSSWSYILSLSVNSQKQPVISGFTYAKDYPVTAGAYDVSGGSSTGYRGFITKFSSDFKSLVFSTYFGKSSSWGTVIQSMGLTKGGDVIFTGQTNAHDFPVTAGCIQSTYGGGANDAFLSRLSADGKTLIYSTYFGGSGDDRATDLSINADEDVYIVGSTANSNFPLTIGAKGVFKYSNSDNMDGFVARIQNDCKKLLWSKMMGGSDLDYFEGLHVNDDDELYIAGYSNSSDFYTTSKAVQKSLRGGYDHIVVKMNKAGTNVFYSTYLGGGGDDYFYSGYWWTSNIRITANVKDEAIVGGVTKSFDYPITSDALQKQNNVKTGVSWSWATNLAITKLDYTGSKILYGTYFGGSQWEWTTVLKVKKISCMSSILYGGVTGSRNYPTTDGVFKEQPKDSVAGWSYSGFMSRFRDTLYTEPINFKSNFIECDNVYEIFDANNRGASYLWSDNSTSKVLIAKDTGTYWVRATYGCDTVSDTVHVSLEYSPKLQFVEDTIVCVSNSLVLDAENDSIIRSYLWNTKDTTQKITVNKPGVYIATVTTPNCGEISDTIHVDFLQKPDIGIPIDSVFCDAINWPLKTDSLGVDTRYLWSTGDTGVNTIIMKTGNHFLKVTNHCGEDSVGFSTDLLKTPTVDLPGDTIVCFPYTLRYKVGLTGNNEIYNWEDPDLQIAYGTSDSLIMSSPGKVLVSIENRCGVAKDSVAITERIKPVLDLGNDSIYCENIAKVIQIGKAGNGEKYYWNSSPGNNKYLIDKEGVYTARIVNLCGDVTDSVRFTRKSKLSLDLGKDSLFCNSISKTLDISQTDPDVVYHWHDGSSGKTFLVDKPGSIFASISNLCGESSDTVNYTLLSTPTVELGPDLEYCDVIVPKQISVGNSGNDETYLWSTASTASTSILSTQGKHWVRIENKCGLATDSISVFLYFSPVVDLGKDTALCGTFSYLLDAGNPGMSYLWEPTGETTQSIFANLQSKYKVTVTDIHGCSGSSFMTIKDDCKSRWFIPNAFSPNADLLNDEFLPYFLNIEKYTLSIYNTWGEKLFETNDPKLGWDGNYLGVEAPSDNYFYKIQFISSESDQWINLKGTILLLR
ncbi:MAG: gliding motility-associated C-terminal domain-containing protein [Flavobacteriales bacterium]|nr:gliding motility-associated C-terminal domain-containing protein [Flavobacteriales bacterium]